MSFAVLHTSHELLFVYLENSRGFLENHLTLVNTRPTVLPSSWFLLYQIRTLSMGNRCRRWSDMLLKRKASNCLYKKIIHLPHALSRNDHKDINTNQKINLKSDVSIKPPSYFHWKLNRFQSTGGDKIKFTRLADYSKLKC